MDASRRRAARDTWLWLAVLAVCALGFVLVVRAMLARTADTAGDPPPFVPAAAAPAPDPAVDAGPVEPVATPPPTPAEIRESQRKADEVMRVIEATTPEI